MKELNDVTNRVLTVFDYLEKNQMIESKRSFCDQIRFHEVSFSKIQVGERDFPQSKLMDLVNAFGVNPDFLMKGTKPMFQKISPIRQINVKDLNLTITKNHVIIKYFTQTANIIEFIIQN